jgi:uridine kinase
MKIALLISGYLRTFKSNIISLKNNILNENEDIDIYIHLTYNENETDKKYINNKNIDNMVSIINKELKPKCLLIENNFNFNNDNKINSLLNQWAKYYKLNSIKILNENIYNQNYDLVIKYRPDLNLCQKFNFNNLNIDLNYIYIPFDSKIDKSKLLNNNDKYICDIFSYGSSIKMNKYFSLYETINNYIYKYGYISETILYHHLTDNNILYKLIDINYNIILSECNIFAICGDSGSGKTTLGNKLKNFFSNPFLLECDRYHKWERNNENWNNFSHLNPDANYIVKMNEDIFNLKIGNNILQVDYDHSKGIFTTPEYIESKDNLIICGLHTLYNTNNIYNMKIFMDTDINLKFYWKIKRDVIERGYTLDNILKQIIKRREDFNKYILPQKNLSDIIICFYTDKEITIDNINDNINIFLKIKIKNTYNLFNIIENFQNYNIPIKIETKNDFIILNFKQYIYNDILFKEFDSNYNLSKTFYDYIIYIIIKLNT